MPHSCPLVYQQSNSVSQFTNNVFIHANISTAYCNFKKIWLLQSQQVSWHDILELRTLLMVGSCFWIQWYLSCFAQFHRHALQRSLIAQRVKFVVCRHVTEITKIHMILQFKPLQNEPQQINKHVCIQQVMTKIESQREYIVGDLQHFDSLPEMARVNNNVVQIWSEWWG